MMMTIIKMKCLDTPGGTIVIPVSIAKDHHYGAHSHPDHVYLIRFTNEDRQFFIILKDTSILILSL